MAMTNQSKLTALITGASSGIGLELARLFAANSFDVVLVARNTQKLNDVAESLRKDYHVDAHVFACDLTLPHATEQLVGDLDRAQLWIDYLVNNAGFGAVGHIVDLPPKHDEDQDNRKAPAAKFFSAVTRNNST